MIVYRRTVPHPLDEVFAWHERPGAFTRLSPPWLPGRPEQEAASLKDGTAVLALPGGLRWVARHRPDGYDPPHAFVDELAAAPGLWRHTHVFSAQQDGGTLVEDRVATPVPEPLLRPLFAYRHRQLSADLASHARARSWAASAGDAPTGAGAGPPELLTVAMTGSSGLVGSALAAFLTTGGHRVVRLVRRAPRHPGEQQWDPDAPSPDVLLGTDAVVHLAGASIAGRFTEAHKAKVASTRTGPTERLAMAAARAASTGDGPRVFVSASAIGYYGYDRGGEAVGETAARGSGFLAQLVADWEEATAPAEQGGLRVCQVRTGIVQSPAGGMLRLLYPVFLAGLGGKLGDGSQWASWVALDDLVDIYYRALLDGRASGPLNAVSPNPVTNATYTAVLARVLHRPALLSVPALAPELLLGAEGAREFAMASQRVLPAALERLGHTFRYPELEGALAHVLGRVGA